jgi:hypothetical protein
MQNFNIRFYFQNGHSSVFSMDDEAFKQLKCMLDSPRVDSFFIGEQWLEKYGFKQA